jgi:hypothetical protein
MCMLCCAVLWMQADQVFAEAYATMKDWPLEWRTMPQRVFSSTLAWLRLRRMGGHGRGGSDQEQPAPAGAAGAAAEAAVATSENEDGDGKNGGWGRDAAVMEQYELSRCDIARRSASEMTVEEFHRDFADLNRPVLITGAMEDWPAWEHWTREGLLARYGERENGWVFCRAFCVFVSRAGLGTPSFFKRTLKNSRFLRRAVGASAALVRHCDGCRVWGPTRAKPDGG